tara:strand:- start:133 stop:855 length:723 start_codon:yes stop_codon:yes gene_type:complete
MHRLKKILQNKLPWVSDRGIEFGVVDFTEDKEKIYNCFNHSEHIHRTMVYDLLKENNLLDYGYVSYRAKGIYLPEEVEYVTSLESPDIMINEFEKCDISYGAFNPKVTSKTYFNVVTETHFELEDLFITEKTCKALISQPFIVVGNYGTIEYLNENGFETYPEMFDESYDLIEDHNKRLEFIIDEVKRLCHMDKSELQKIYESVLWKVEHNRNIVMNWKDDEFLEELKDRHIGFPDHQSF